MAEAPLASRIESFRNQMGWDADEASANFPRLCSTRGAFNTYVSGDLSLKFVREWFLKNWPASGDDASQVAGELIERIIFDVGVRKQGDQACRYLCAALWDVGSTREIAVDGKTDFVGPLVPALIAVYDRSLVTAAWISPRERKAVSGAHVSIFPLTDVVSIHRIKVGKLWATAPGIQIVTRVDGERDVSTFTFADVLPKQSISTLIAKCKPS